MELRHLRYFVAVAEELHFGRAARRLHLSQPPLSQQIADLEREMGLKLFNRIGRRVTLSAAGSDFLDSARRVLAETDKAVLSAQRADRGEVGSLEIGFVGAMAYTYLPQILRVYRSRFPDVSLVLHELSIPQQLQALSTGRLQVGLLRPPVESAELESETLFSEPFVVALPVDHPLASRHRLSLQALRNELFIMYPRRIGGRFYDNVLALCQAAGFSPRVSQEVTQMHAAIGLVTARLGIAIVPASIQVLNVAGVVYRPLTESKSGADIAIAWRRNDLTPTVSAFLEVARELIPASAAAYEPSTPQPPASDIRAPRQPGMRGRTRSRA